MDQNNNPDIPLSQEGNKLLTAAFYHAGIHGKELATLNQCCVFLQVATIADIVDGSGYYISDPMLIGIPNNTFTSRFTWPNQGKPTKKEWARWHLSLQLAIQWTITGSSCDKK